VNKKTTTVQKETKAVVLLSGGLDSTTVLFHAMGKGYRCHCLIFDYGQRHRKELQKAKAIARGAGVPFDVVRITMPWKGSALLDRRIKVPQGRAVVADEIPATYVPARNIIFLSFAASCAEAAGARTVFIGANALDYSGYPDCRPEFFKAYQMVLKKGLKASLDGKTIRIAAPLLHKTKAQIIRLGRRLNVPYELTWSCYKGGRRPCGQCDSCLLRAKGFQEAGHADPLLKNR
jgi:7-cyano-7-deazaguanine synthase